MISRWCGRCLTTHVGVCPKIEKQRERWHALKKSWSRQHGRVKRRTPAANAMRHQLKKDGGSCAKCGTTEKLEVDHIIAIRDGGQDIESNLQVLCRTCHGKKSYNEWLGGRHERMRQASGIMRFTRARG